MFDPLMVVAVGEGEVMIASLETLAVYKDGFGVLKETP
jgi:hypothetical protein